MILSVNVQKLFQKSCHHSNNHSIGTISSSKLYILLFLFLLPSQYLVAARYVAHEVYKANVSEEDPSQMNPMDYARFRRDATVFSAAVTNLQSLSRIASAITLEIGLMDKTLNPQLVIPELLRMGDVKPSEITSLNPDDVKNSVSQLVDLPKNVAETTPPNPVENRLVTLENMREVAAGFKDFANIPGKAEYEESLKKVKELDNLVDSFKTFKSDVGVLKAYFEGAKTEDKLSQSFSLIFGSLENVESIAKTFNTKPIQDAKTILETSKFIDLIVLEKKFRDSTPSFDYDDSHVKAVLDNFKNVYESSQKAKNAISHFETIRKLMNSRDASHKQSYDFASGLPRGSNDLAGLTKDIKSDWIKRHINSNEDVTKNLGFAFQHFNGLVKELGDAESSWSPLNSDLERAEIGKVLDVIMQIAEISGDYKSFTVTMNKLRDCDTYRNYFPAEYEKIEVLNNNITSLNKQIKTLGDFKDIDFFKDLPFKKHFDARNMPDQQKKDLVRVTFGKLSTDVDILKFKEKLNNLHQDLERFSAAIENIKSLQIDVNVTIEYVADVMKGTHIQIYDCLAKIQTEKSPVKEAFEILHILRSTSIVENADGYFTKIFQSIPHLTSAEELAKEFPSFNDFQSTSLKPSGLSHGASQALGLGVQGLSAIQKVYNARINLRKLVGRIFNEPKFKTLSPEHQKSLKDLRKLYSVFNGVENFIQSFGQASRRKRATGFEDAKKVFDEAAKVSGAILDFKTIRPAMEQLQKEKIFEALEKLEFDFSRFKIAEAGDHLTNLDKFFLEYAKKVRSAQPLETEKKFIINQSMDGFQHFVYDYPVTAWTLMIFLVLVVVVVPIGVIYFFYKRKYKDSEQKS